MGNEKLKFANLKVGITVLIGIAIFFFFIIIVGTEINYFSRTLTYKIFLKNVEGFSSGSMVTLGGLKIGSVDDIEFATRDGVNGIDVTFTINAKYERQITESSIATIKTKGLLGDKYIDLSIGQEDETPISDGAYVPLDEPITLETFTKKLEPAVDDLAKVLNNLNTITANLTSENSAVGVLLNNEQIANEIKTVVSDLRSFTKAVANQKGTLGKLAYDDSLYENLNKLSGNLNDFTTSINMGQR